MVDTCFWPKESCEVGKHRQGSGRGATERRESETGLDLTSGSKKSRFVNTQRAKYAFGWDTCLPSPPFLTLPMNSSVVTILYLPVPAPSFTGPTGRKGRRWGDSKVKRVNP